MCNLGQMFFRVDYLGMGGRASLVAQIVKKLPVMWETRVHPWVGKIPWGGGEDPLPPWRRAWQPITVFLPGESPWTQEPGGLQSMGLQRTGHDWGLSTAHLGGRLIRVLCAYDLLQIFFILRIRSFKNTSSLWPLKNHVASKINYNLQIMQKSL